MTTWKPVVGFEGRFEVSDIGKVRSLDRVLVDGRRWKARASKPKASRTGHLAVRLCDGKHYWLGVHRLVLEAFIGPCPDGMEGCHNDGNPANNTLANLRWDTRAGNHADKIAHGTSLHGSRNHLAKLCAEDILAIREMSRGGITARAISAKYSVTAANISSILAGKTWQQIGER